MLLSRRTAPRESTYDGILIALAFAYGAALVAKPGAVPIALGVWWSSNTIAHNFIHRPFFRAPAANRMFALYLSVVTGIPQAMWRERHLAHHAGRRPAVTISPQLAAHVAAVATLWGMLAILAPAFFVGTYLPGYAAGLLLCALHGHFEHSRGTTSHYGRLYNLLFFNDGYHVEHHARPGVHWSRLPALRDGHARHSIWPAPLRWLDAADLAGLERLVLRSALLQRLVVRVHARSLSALIAELPRRPGSIAIVGGGLFPRTALILCRLCPQARITIIEVSQEHLEIARRALGDTNIRFVHACYGPDHPEIYDAVVIPLAYSGDRAALYEHPPARTLIVHDWLWHKRGVSRIVALPLLKRINLVCQ